MNFPVFDFHCDTALKHLRKDVNQAGQLRKNALHIDLERGKTLAGYAQCFAIFTTTAFKLPNNIKPEDIFSGLFFTIFLFIFLYYFFLYFSLLYFATE